ncbi:outer membrane lipoprotein carrier protein LolA [Chitinophaga japonensis]
MQAYAQTGGFKPVANLEAFKQQFAKAAQNTQSIQADFVQEKHLSMLSDKIVSKGKFWFRKENKVRMEYQQPSYYLMIMNGKNIITRDGQRQNRVNTAGNKLFEQINRITVDCVRGNVLNNPDFKAAVLENAQHYRLDLTPVSKALQQYFKTIQLLVDKQDYSVSRIIMLEPGGDHTTISFLHKQMNVDIPDAVFTAK